LGDGGYNSEYSICCSVDRVNLVARVQRRSRVSEVHAIQWLQGIGDDQSIMQWVPPIKEIQARGVPIIVDLSKGELSEFMGAMDPKGLFLWVVSESEEEEIALLRKVEQWIRS
jgi:hypothetical protein